MKKALAIGWTLVILALFTIPGSSLPKDSSLLEFDKLAHFGLFVIFGVCWMWALNQPLKRRVVTVLVAGIAYAWLTEVYQGLLPFERTPDVYDAIANTAGLLVAVFGYVVWEKRRSR